MSLIVLCADKGSPGVTTATLALATAWPRRAAVAELDPSGADLTLRLTDRAGRYVLAPRPGLLTWAAARTERPESFWTHCQTIAGRPPILPGAAGAEQAIGLERLWPDLAAALAATDDGDILADVGRLMPTSPSMPVAMAADLVVVVAAPTVEGLVHARDRARALVARGVSADRSGAAPPRVLLLVVAPDRIGPRIVEAAQRVLERKQLPVDVLGFIAVDMAGVTALHTGRDARLARSLLMRTARQIAAEICASPQGGEGRAISRRPPTRGDETTTWTVEVGR